MLFPKNTLTCICTIGFLLLSQLSWSQCEMDIIAPVINGPNDMSVSCLLMAQNDLTDPDLRNQLFGEATATDNCELLSFSEGTAYIDVDLCSKGTMIRSWEAIDTSGNATYYNQTITFAPETKIILQIPDDVLPGLPLILVTTLDEGCSLSTLAWHDTVYSFGCTGEADQFSRRFLMADFCTLSGDSLQPIMLPRLDIDGDGQNGDAYQVILTDTGAYLWENGMKGDSLAPWSEQYQYTQEVDMEEDSENVHVQGTVFHDEIENCSWDITEVGIPNYQIKVTNLNTGFTAFTTSDEMGQYEFDFCAGFDSISISSYNPYNISGSCEGVTTFVLPPGTIDTFVNLPTQLPCTPLFVDIGTWSLRRCFDNKYLVSYSNLSPLDQEDVYIEVQLDDFMDFTDASIPWIDLGNNLYRFELGDLTALYTGNFRIDFELSCEALLGQTHCVSAEIFPVEVCDTINMNEWSGASIAIVGTCEGDSIKVDIQNVGEEDMPNSRNYIIVEDVIMMSINPFQLNMGEQLTFNLPATGSTWHVSAEQEAFHPGLSQPSITIEGCGGNNNPGQAMSFPQNDADPNVAIDCRINIGSWDPNDKQVVPAGIGEDREIEANVDLEYMIRFQNTGTDTAFNIRVIDQLPSSLNWDVIRPGASSHPYTFEKLPQGELHFNFDNIMLPDSTTDLEGSQGFVKFNVLQQLDNAPGTVIHNQAEIYFDFNDPIITNDAFVTINDHPYGVINYVPELANPQSILIVPNPTQAEATLWFKTDIAQSGQLYIYNINGQLINSQKINGQKTRLEFQGWPKGIYPIELIVDGKKIERGKIVIQ